MNDTYFLIVGIVLTIIGALMLASVLVSRVKCKTAVEAVVSRVSVKKSYLRGKTYKFSTPVFTYTFNSKKYTQKANISTLKTGKYTAGDTFTVYIDPKNPAAMRFGTNIGVIVCGALFLAAGLILTVCYFL